MNNYTIDQFSQITGLNKILIRTWENRYGFINPRRTCTNIRYYDDMMVTKGIKFSLLVDNGYKISKVINLSDKELSLAVEKTLKLSKDLDVKISIYISKFIESSILFDQILFEETYESCIKDLGFKRFYEDVLMRTMNKVGILWLNSKMNPANEHFLSENIRIKLCHEIDKCDYKIKGKNRWILFLPEEEFHDIGLLYTYLSIKMKGHDVIYLGQNVPRESLLSIDNKDKNILSFLISNKPDDFYNRLTKFLSDNFSRSKIFIVSNHKQELNNCKNLKNTSDLREFIEKI